jgi:hypothetical protein
MLLLTNGTDLLRWLESSDLALFFRNSLWLYPAVEIVHIIGFAVLVGAAFLFDLRLLGLARKLPVTECIRHFIFWARVSFLAVLPSGFILFTVDASGMAENPAFRIKMVLIVFAGINAAFFHRYTLKSVDMWNINKSPPPPARIAGVLSILLWFSVIACGRIIAYI